jgi:exodeoxyribonuclease V gamma subunit
LPVGVAGLEAWHSVVQCAAPIAARIAAWRARSERLPPVAFELALPDGAVLDCVLAEPYREGLLYWSPSRLHGTHWLQPWIEHLALCAWPDRERAGVRREPGCIRIGWSEGGTEAIELPTIAPDVALDELALLLQGWREGQTTPLPFFPRASWAYASAVASNPHAESDGHALHKARVEYANDRGYAEGSDAWIALAFRDRDPFEDGEPVARFRQQALRVFGTLAGLVQAREG